MDELDVDSIFKLKVDELKQELGKRNLPKSGSKADLVERLLQHVTNKLYDTNDSVLEDSAIATEADTKLEASLEAELENQTDEHTDEHTEEATVEGTEGNFDQHGTGDTEQAETEVTNANSVSDEFVSTDELPNDGIPSSNNDSTEEFKTIHQTGDEDVSANIVSGADMTTSAPDVESKPKFCRVTITSPIVSDKQKKEDRSKRFSDSLGSPQDEADKKKARLGRFSSTSMGKGETITEDDIEKIKKRAERFGPVSSILTPGGELREKLDSRRERFADPAVKKRQERFGQTASSSLNLSSDMEARKQSRLAKFGAL